MPWFIRPQECEPRNTCNYEVGMLIVSLGIHLGEVGMELL